MIFRKKGQSIVRMYYMVRIFWSIGMTGLICFLAKAFQSKEIFFMTTGFCISWVVDRIFEGVFFEVHTRMKIRKLRNFVRMFTDTEKKMKEL